MKKQYFSGEFMIKKLFSTAFVLIGAMAPLYSTAATTNSSGTCQAVVHLQVKWQDVFEEIKYGQAQETIISEWVADNKWQIVLSPDKSLSIYDLSILELSSPGTSVVMKGIVSGSEFTNENPPAPDERAEYQIKGSLLEDNQIRLDGFHAGWTTAIGSTTSRFMRADSAAPSEAVKLSCP